MGNINIWGNHMPMTDEDKQNGNMALFPNGENGTVDAGLYFRIWKDGMKFNIQIDEQEAFGLMMGIMGFLEKKYDRPISELISNSCT